MNVDVCIVGGGMVGVVQALALGLAGVKVVVVEANASPAAMPEPYALRVSALTRASQRILEALGVWVEIPAERLSPYAKMQVWDAGGFGKIGFDAAEIGQPNLGHIVENGVLLHTLERRAEACEAIRWVRGETVDAVEFTKAGVKIRLSGERIQADLVIGADGALSRVRELVGIDVSRKSYDQRAVVANVRTEHPHAQTARQLFLRSGPLAFLPLPEPHANAVVWSTDPDHAAHLLKLSPVEFCTELGCAFDHRLGMLESSSETRAFALQRIHALEYTRPHLALVGDAAHVVHPLAGQGVNLGLLDAAALAEQLLEGRAKGRGLGGRVALRRYERWRKGHNRLTQSAMDGFRWLFGQTTPPLRFARSIGLSVADRTPMLKHQLMVRAMGLAGDMPRLARTSESMDGAGFWTPG